ncbi:GntR family transcriptional regulator [Citricoccus sp. GCM10030269]|uniref:GntR family transcriptional regulator n=1 Tax=Citricoccus sp. GCM10030269 TaxID=3273388 RepID=UPI00360DD500
MTDPERGATAAHAHTGAWVTQVLRERISAGELLPGTKLAEQALAESLAVSRNTLREAFTVLAGESIVERVPNRGVFVASPHAEDIREVYRIRRMLEPAALLWGELGEETVAGLHAVVDRALAARDAGDVRGMADANQHVHGTIVALSGSETLRTVMDQTLARMRLVFHGMAAAPDFHARYAERNRVLVGLLESGCREDAAEAMRDYLDTAERELLDWLGHEDEPKSGSGAAQGIR